MIDLSKNQIVDPMVEAWFWDYKENVFKGNLVSIDHRGKYPYCEQLCGGYKYCSLTDPTKPKVKKWETVMDVPASLWGNALVKSKNTTITNATILNPCNVSDDKGLLFADRHYLPLGQPLDGEWSEFEEEIIEQ